MTLAALFAALAGAGVRLGWAAGALSLDAPRGALTPELRAAVLEHREALEAVARDEADERAAMELEAVEPDELQPSADVVTYPSGVTIDWSHVRVLAPGEHWSGADEPGVLEVDLRGPAMKVAFTAPTPPERAPSWPASRRGAA